MKDDIYAPRYGVRRCFCGREDCRRWTVGDYVHGSLEASMNRQQADAVAFVLNAMEDGSPVALTVTTAGVTRTQTFAETEGV